MTPGHPRGTNRDIAGRHALFAVDGEQSGEIFEE